MPVTQRNGAWTVDFRFEGKRVRKKSPLNTHKGAQEYERLLLTRLLNGKPLDPRAEDPVDKACDTTCEAFLREWLNTYARTHNKESEIASKESIVRCHLIPFFGSTRVRELDVRALDRFKSAQLGKGLSRKTVNNQLMVLRRSLVSAKEWGLISHVPTIKWLKAEKPKFDFLTVEESELLLEATPAEFYPMVLTALRTGLRRGELRALRWEDVDFNTHKLVVRRAFWKAKLGTTKSGRQREVPLSSQLELVLKRHRHLRGPWVFCQENGKALTNDVLKRRLPAYCRKAGIGREVQWHTLRHTFASHLVVKGVPLKVIQELLGHATIEMTMRYAHLSESAHTEAIAKLDQPSGLSGHSVVTASGTRS